MKFLLACFLLSSCLMAGGITSNGGDNEPVDKGSAWFVGQENVIKACYEISRDFNVSEDVIRNEILTTFDMWKVYYLKKLQMDTAANGETYSGKVNGKDTIVPINIFKLAFNMDLRSECPQIFKADLKFYFGINNKEVENAKKNFYDPIAFAYRSMYDINKAWGRGFVWVAKKSIVAYNDWDWVTPANLNPLRIILLHEFGHVFGTEHVEGTIMTKNILSYISMGALMPPFPPGTSVQIDGVRELVFYPYPLTDEEDSDSFSNYKGRISMKGNAESEKETFRLFTGRWPQGIYRALAHFNKIGSNDFMTITYTDEVGETVFPVYRIKDEDSDIFHTISPVVPDTEVFKVAAHFGYGMAYTMGGANNAVEQGMITGSDGEKYFVVAELNMGGEGSPLHLKYFKGGEMRDLFAMPGFWEYPEPCAPGSECK